MGKVTSIEDRTDHLGNVYESKQKMLDAYGRSTTTYNMRIRTGWTKENALTIGDTNFVSEDERTDHLGNVYPTIQKMLDAYGRDEKLYRKRRKNGWSVEEALTIPAGEKRNKIIDRSGVEYGDIEDRTDHLGQVFNSKKAMCEHWETTVDAYHKRRKSGWSKEKALTTKNKKNRPSIEDRTDHLGQVFESKSEMCEHWETTVNKYNSRRRSGYTKEQALTASYNDIGFRSDIEDRTDHLGNIFQSKKHMLDHYETTYIKYDKRIKDGYTKEQALTMKDDLNIGNIEDRTDHLGQVFESIKAMCKHWDKEYATYTSRLERGYSKEEALTLNDLNSKDIESRTDHLGTIFDTIKVMCTNYKVSYGNYVSQTVKLGWYKEEALHIIPRIGKMCKDLELLDYLTIVKFAYNVDSELYFKCKLNEKLTILSKSEIIDIYRREMKFCPYNN